jgi:hypothetical protein
MRRGKGKATAYLKANKVTFPLLHTQEGRQTQVATMDFMVGLPS